MSDSPSHSRAKRQRIDKQGRFAALERLKNLKGSKNKYEVGEVENVYEEVSEKEYAKRVLSRAGDDWLEEDGTGYVEDGREIFDEEDDNIEESTSARKRKGDKTLEKTAGKKRLRDVNKPVQGSGSIQSLFGNVVGKKKESQVKLDEDDILAGILGEIDPDATTSNCKEATSSMIALKTDSAASHSNSKIDTKTEMAMVKEYMQSFTKLSTLKKSDKKVDTTEDDDAYLERVLKPSAKKATHQQQLNNLSHGANSLRDSDELPPFIDGEKKKIKNDIENQLATSIKLESEPLIPTKANIAPTIDEYKEDMDFSILENDENQFIATGAPASAEKIKSKQTAQEVKQNILCKEMENYENLLSNWENLCSTSIDDDDELLGSIDVGHTQALTGAVDEKGAIKFWFWDAWAEPYKFPGKVFLFGKMPLEQNPSEFKSICVTIENVEKCLYLLPRKYALDPMTKQQTNKEVTLQEVYDEFLANFPHGFKSKKVTKYFAFNVPGVKVPQECEYLKVRYDGKIPAPDTKKTFNTIAHIFGCNTNPLETFLLECKIKGPTWLNISNYSVSKQQQSTWCSLAITCPTASSISVATDTKCSLPPPPPLVVTTINVRTALNPKTQTNEVVMIVCLVNHRFSVDKRPPNPPFTKHFCGFTRPSSQNWPMSLNETLAKYKAAKTTKLDSERALLSWFLTVFKNIDSDLIVTHDASDCQLDIICDRLLAIKLPMWSRIGRLNLSAMPKKFKDFFVGRMICDVKSSAEELIKSRSYDLDTLCKLVLKIKEDERTEVSNDELYELYESADGILKLITLTLQDCSYVMRLMCELNVLPLALQITNICGNLMGRTLQGGRSERNEFLLLHAFDEKDYIVPDKKQRESMWGITKDNAIDQSGAVAQGGRKKPAYAGGLVLDPLKGFYDKYILLMDFNSLYPSIIQEYNICFTTVDAPDNEDDIVEVPDPNLEQGVLPRQIRNLVECRREVKKLIVPGLEADLKNQYNIRQLALKLTANSMYGCLGFSNSRFYAKHLAALVTQKGRDILLNTKGIVTKLNYEVIYGDTDSIMINTHCVDYDEVFRISHTIKQAVNKIYRQVELDIDGVYKYMLLLNKKKYAAVTVTKLKSGELVCNQELKGLDIVRRDWSQISVMAGKLVLDELLSDSPLDERLDNIHVHLEKIRDNINEDKVPLGLLTITRQLTKAPKDYQNTQSMPHVQVALRMNSTRNKRYKQGDMVSYVICIDGTDRIATQRSYHLDELKTNSNLKIDKLYYLANQVHPVVTRLLKPIEGTDAARIAQCLGLDPTKYRERITYDGERSETIGESIVQSNAAKYRLCNKFTFKCIACKTDNVIIKPFIKSDKQFVPVLQACANKECTMAPVEQLSNIRNHLSLAIRKTIQDYYDNWLICDEPNCNQSTRTYVHVIDVNNRPLCITCKRGYLLKTMSEGELYTQLKYFQYIFDLPRYEQTLLRTTSEMEDAFKILKEYVDHVLKRSAYQNIKLSHIFKQLQPNMGVLNYCSFSGTQS